jgi:hypothetical protein
MSNSGGSVFEIAFKRTLGIRGYNSRCAAVDLWRLERFLKRRRKYFCL